MLKILKAACKTWFQVRRSLKIPYYCTSAPIWESPGTPTCLIDKLAAPLAKSGLNKWGQILNGKTLASWDTLDQLTAGRLSRFKYYQLSSWARELGKTGEGSANYEIKQLMGTPQAKENAKWYWKLIEAGEEPYSMLGEIWTKDLPSTQTEDLWLPFGQL